MSDPPALPDPAPRPNPEHADDVSVPVMTVSVASMSRVGFDDDAASADQTDATSTRFDDLFRAHYDRLVRSLTVASGDREQAADAVQEAFVKAHVRWRRIGRYDDPIGWVRRVAINQLRDDHRRPAANGAPSPVSRPAHLSPSSPANPTSSAASSPGSPASSASRRRCTTSTGCRPPRSRATLGLAEGTVKSHLSDARERLRAALDDERRSDQER
jgi:RNA polymerase sigma-70 factor (ECF subfamily)